MDRSHTDASYSNSYSAIENHLWDDNKNILFRDVTAPNRLTMNTDYEAVDIKRSKSDMSLSLLWDDISLDSWFSSTCVLHQPDEVSPEIMNKLCENKYQALCKISRTLFVKFGAKVTKVHGTPVTLTLAHQTPEAYQDMRRDGPRLREIFYRVLCPNEPNRLTLHLEGLVRHGEETGVSIQSSKESLSERQWSTEVNLDNSSSTSQSTADDKDARRRISQYLDSDVSSINYSSPPSTVISHEDFQQSDASTVGFPDEPLTLSQGRSLQSVGDNTSQSRGLQSSFADNTSQSRGLQSSFADNTSQSRGLQSVGDDTSLGRGLQSVGDDTSLGRGLQSVGDDTSLGRGLQSVGDETSLGRGLQSVGDETSLGRGLQSVGDDTSLGSGLQSVGDDTSQGRGLQSVGDDTSQGRSLISVGDNAAHTFSEGEEWTGSSFTTPNELRPLEDVTAQSTQRDVADPFSDSYIMMLNATERADDLLRRLGVTERTGSFERLRETTGFAMMDDAVMPPKGECLDTVLCLDASSSLGQKGFEKMKKIALQIVEGLESVAVESEIEENISVVVFGGRSRIVHFLSNDYSSVGDAIADITFGGRSPLFEALLVCLCAIRGRGGTLSISGVHRLKPRLIILTDGKPSDETEDLPHDVDKVDQKVIGKILQLLDRFKKGKSSIYPYPIFWIPVGDANENLIDSMAKMSGGEVRSGKDVRKLCRYQKIQKTVGKIFSLIAQGLYDVSGDLTDDIRILIDAFSGDLDPEEKEEVVDTVKGKLEGKHGYDCEDEDQHSFNNVLELHDSPLPPLGSRVLRGEHWKWENQDTNGPGTVTNHCRNEKGWIIVEWDNGNKSEYRFGADGCYDVKVVEDQPRYIQSEMLIRTGCQVTRGLDWEARYGDQDGGAGGVGVVIRTNESTGEVKVRWNLTHQICVYRYGKDDKVDLKIRDPVDILKKLTWVSQRSSSESRAGTLVLPEPERPLAPDDGVYSWEWRGEDRKWNTYSDENVTKLEEAYSKQSGSCLITRCSVTCRVVFKDMVERVINGGSKLAVRRVRSAQL